MDTHIIPPAPASDLNFYVSLSASAWVWIAAALAFLGLVAIIAAWLAGRNKEEKPSEAKK
jgi:hypothetical protein